MGQSDNRNHKVHWVRGRYRCDWPIFMLCWYAFVKKTCYYMVRTCMPWPCKLIHIALLQSRRNGNPAVTNLNVSGRSWESVSQHFASKVPPSRQGQTSESLRDFTICIKPFLLSKNKIFVRSLCQIWVSKGSFLVEAILFCLSLAEMYVWWYFGLNFLKRLKYVSIRGKLGRGWSRHQPFIT
jgi:hypothetical protein